MIVVDANVIGYLVLPGEGGEHSERVALRDGEWCAPGLWRSEFLSAAAKHVRRGDLSVVNAVGAYQRASAIIGNRERTAEVRAVLDLAIKSKCSTYDCEYVALAVELGVPLVTWDKAVLKAFPHIAVSPEDFIKQ